MKGILLQIRRIPLGLNLFNGRLKVSGPVRCERFTDAVLELYDSFEKGYVSLEDIHKTLKEETGITIVSDGRLKDRGN